MSSFKSTAVLLAALATGAIASLVSGDAIAGLKTVNALTTNGLSSNALTHNALIGSGTRVDIDETDMAGMALNGIRLDSATLVLPSPARD